MSRATIHALDAGNYARANEYAVEAFLLHLQCLFMNRYTSRIDLWFEMGTIIRLAVRMGYHRDPTRLSGCSILEGEMRRRTWLNLTQLDVLLSHQTGCPSMIPTHACDTALPMNLQYSDLHLEMSELPQSRPFQERTPVLYSIVKEGVVSVFKKIVNHLQSLSLIPHATVMDLDQEMRRAYRSLPESYQRHDISRSFMDAAGLIFERVTLECVYLHGIIVLHRSNVTESRDPALEPSRRACVDAALELLLRQIEIHRACEPGERLYDDRALFMALPFHDFLLAAMVTCLDLSHQFRLLEPESSTDAARGHQRPRQAPDRDYRSPPSWLTSHEAEILRQRQIQALHDSREVWMSAHPSLPDARTAAMVIDVMINRLSAYDRVRFAGDPDSLGMVGPFPNTELMTSMIAGVDEVDWVSVFISHDTCDQRTDEAFQALLDQYLFDFGVLPESADVTDELFVP